MTISASLSARAVSLDQLAALSDEIRALVSAGVPLDRGLRDLAADMPGRVGRLADRMGRQLEQGRSLSDVMERQFGASLPPEYRAVIVAGERGGRLPAALEEVASTARRISQLRQSLGLAIVYPLVVLAAAWVLFLFVLVKLLPVMARVMIDFGYPAERFERAVAQLIPTAMIWGPLIPAVTAAWLAIAWYRSGLVAHGVELRGWLSFGAVSTLRRIQRAGRIASMADLLALLVDNEVPLPEAIELASAAVGSPALANGGKLIAARLRRGEMIDHSPSGFPPLLTWIVAGSTPRLSLSASLRRTAKVYREEFVRRSQWLALYVPLVLTIVVAGGTVAIYALLTLGPWLMIMHRLSDPFFS